MTATRITLEQTEVSDLSSNNRTRSGLKETDLNLRCGCVIQQNTQMGVWKFFGATRTVLRRVEETVKKVELMRRKPRANRRKT